MAATDFLTLLVNETFELQKSGEAELSSFELKLKDYDLSFLKGEFIPQYHVLRFQTELGVIDIPVNWSVFDLNEHATETVIEEENDEDHLLHVFKHAWNSKLTKLLIAHADGFCYIVGLKSGEELHIHDLLTPQEMLKAA